MADPDVEVPDYFASMFILGLPGDEDEIHRLFAPVGRITEIRLLPQKDDSKPGRAGVITMSCKEEAVSAMEHFKFLDMEHTGRRMKMSWDTRSLDRITGRGGQRSGGFGGGADSSSRGFGAPPDGVTSQDIPEDFASLFVFGLPDDEDEIRKIFSEVGTVADLKLLPKKDDKTTRVGVITMSTKREALDALSHFKFKELESTGRRMKLEWDSRSLQKRTGGGSGGQRFGDFGDRGASSGGFGDRTFSSSGGGFGERRGFGEKRENVTPRFGDRGEQESGDGFCGRRFGERDHDTIGSLRFGDVSGESPRFATGNSHIDPRRRGFGVGDSVDTHQNAHSDDAMGAREGKPDSDDAEARAPVTYIPAENLSRDALKLEHNVAGINFKKYGDVPVVVTGENPVQAITSFDHSGLHANMMEAARYMNYLTPTPIQKYSIPAILAKRDVMGCAQTGSGKTAGYLLPIISNMLEEAVEPATAAGKSQPQVLVVCPTRELASQVDKEAHVYVEGSGLKTFAVYGQTELRHMANKLRCGVNIVSATTGRLKQCLDMGLITLEKLQYLILDEADRMLDMGFHNDIEAIVLNKTMPRERVTLMFSATFAPDIQQLAGRFLKNYLFITTGIIGGACGDVTQVVLKCEGRADKKEMLEDLLRTRAADNNGRFEKTLIFCETKEETDKIGLELGVNGISSTTIHGNRSQEQREAALADFKSGRKAVLVATNVAARGLDIPDVKHVINWDLPRTPDDMTEYVHRIGRTGRVGNQGLATTFYSSRSAAVAPKLVQIMEASGNQVPDFLYEEAGMSIPQSHRPTTASNLINDRFGGLDTRASLAVREASPGLQPGPSRFGDLKSEDYNKAVLEPLIIPCRWETNGNAEVNECRDERSRQETRLQRFGSTGIASHSSVKEQSGLSQFGGNLGDGGDPSVIPAAAPAPAPAPAPVSRFGGFGRRAAK